MSTATAIPPKTGTVTKPTEVTISYVPLGETETIHLTLDRVRRFLCTPTKSGKYPSDEQVMKFMMMCKAQSLNPWLNDAYLVGYDSKDGPSFSLITAHQSFLKRAEASSQFDGMESGVIVLLRDGEIKERAGDLLLNGEELVGGWARVHRRDRSVPSYDAVNLKTFDQGRSRWNADKAGMIVKCAEASALRKAFPSTLAALYCREEMDAAMHSEQAAPADTRSKTDRLADRLVTPERTIAIEHQHAEPAFVPPERDMSELEPVHAADNTDHAPGPQPQAERPPEPPTAMGFIEAIEGALNATALRKIGQDAARAQADGFLDMTQLDEINSMIQEAKKNLK